MTPETKEMREATETKSGPVVATQWPTTVKFTEDEKSAGELAVKYSHLKQLDPDDKPAYKELVTAIAVARNKRLDIGKQEDVIKDPINKYRTLLINTSKKIQALFGDVESDLKKEKKRIDDIREERKLAMERLWQENLNSISLLTSSIADLTQQHLIDLLADLGEYDFEALDFGDYLDQAKTAVATAVNVVTERIEFMKEQKRLADQKLWQGNLNTVNNWATFLENETDEGIQDTIERLENFDISSMEFGEYLEDAKTGVLAALNRALHEDKRRSDAKAEQKRRDDEAAERKRQDDERKENEAAEQEKRDDERAEADRKQAETDAENQKLRDQIAAMQKEKEPEPEIIGADMASESDTSVIVGVEVDETGTHVTMTPVSGRAAAIAEEPESTVDRDRETMSGDDIVEDYEEEENIDPAILVDWAKEIRIAKESISGFVVTPKGKKAVEAVSGQLDQIYSYLTKTAESLR